MGLKEENNEKLDAIGTELCNMVVDETHEVNLTFTEMTIILAGLNLFKKDMDKRMKESMVKISETGTPEELEAAISFTENSKQVCADVINLLRGKCSMIARHIKKSLCIDRGEIVNSKYGTIIKNLFPDKYAGFSDQVMDET